ncbi:hypothetical protein OG552_09205 [Streptomyces sp. NBC_01476]|uniref:DUF6907 domain-containing protein n=1 Tax=Streptomyces sp. NBC_01476 TaxID=2903881 RepID=UPI002E302192|nr:hypothetical protein [Streptomyces sp. NBC_01476]
MTTASIGARPTPIEEPTQQPAADKAAFPSRTWSINTTVGITLTGYLPPWAEGDPSASDVPLEKLSVELIDLSHWMPFDGQPMRIHYPSYADGNGKAGESEEIVFSGNITCYPYSENLRERTPFANVRVVDDFWMNNLIPDEVAGLAAKLRTQADYLEKSVVPTLEAARSDWEVHQISRANHILP